MSTEPTDTKSPMKVEFVGKLPDLIFPEEYSSDPEGRRIRFRIKKTDHGIELLGDAMTPHELEQILAEMDVKRMQQMLCG